LKNTNPAIAYFSIKSGDAAQYAYENEERLKILKDSSIKIVELDEFTVFPRLIFLADIEQDATNYKNNSMAGYYGKISVSLKSTKTSE
jgi:hypothetical protein